MSDVVQAGQGERGLSEGGGEDAGRIRADGEQFENIRRTLVKLSASLRLSVLEARTGWEPRVRLPSLPHRHLHCSCYNMSFRKPFSKAREKMKYGLSRIGGKLGRGGANAGGEGSNRSALSLQSGPASIVVEGEVRGENSKTGGEDNPVPRSVVERGHDLGESSQGDPHLLPHVEVESVSGREGGDQSNAPQSDVGNAPPISSRDGESEGM